MAFKQMENISAFLMGADKVGVRKSEQFQTVDLYEAKNMMAVVDCIWALSRMAHAKKITTNPDLLLGPKLADSREIHFSEEQLVAGKAAIPMQAGYTGGANQSGSYLLCYISKTNRHGVWRHPRRRYEIKDNMTNKLKIQHVNTRYLQTGSDRKSEVPIEIRSGMRGPGDETD